jgi:hypothetical protein
MTAPAKASLQRELRAMTKRAEEEERASLRAIDIAARLANENAALKAAARPVVAYMDTQWPGSVGPELRRLKELCK